MLAALQKARTVEPKASNSQIREYLSVGVAKLSVGTENQRPQYTFKVFVTWKSYHLGTTVLYEDQLKTTLDSILLKRPVDQELILHPSISFNCTVRETSALADVEQFV